MHYKTMPHFDTTDIARFWSKVEQSTPDKCWTWKLTPDNGGYGMFKKQGVAFRAHRIAYFLHYGVDPQQKLVCHHCDNPACCNPHHLFLGTAKDNIQDALSKNRLKPRSGNAHGSKTHPERTARGERVSTAKLTESQVREIRQTYAARLASQDELASRFDVSRRSIGFIISGKNWRHIAEQDGLGSLIDPSRRTHRY